MDSWAVSLQIQVFRSGKAAFDFIHLEIVIISHKGMHIFRGINVCYFKGQPVLSGAETVRPLDGKLRYAIHFQRDRHKAILPSGRYRIVCLAVDIDPTDLQRTDLLTAGLGRPDCCTLRGEIQNF